MQALSKDPFIEETLSLLKEIVVNKLNLNNFIRNMGMDNVRDSIVRCILFPNADIRLYLISNEAQVTSIWEYIREDEGSVDFIMTTLAEFKFRLMQYSKIDAVMSHLTSLITSAFISNEFPGVMDEDTHSRLPIDENDFHALIRDNPWLIIIYLLSMLDLTEEIRRLKK